MICNNGNIVVGGKEKKLYIYDWNMGKLVETLSMGNSIYRGIAIGD